VGRVARLLQLVDRPAPIPATAKIAIHESRAHKRVPLPGPPRRGPRAATSQGCQAGRARRQQSPVGRTGLHEGYFHKTMQKPMQNSPNYIIAAHRINPRLDRRMGVPAGEHA